MSKPALRILFWNVRGSRDFPLISKLVSEKDIDVLALAELEASQEDELLTELKYSAASTFQRPLSSKSRVHVYGRGLNIGLDEVYDGGRVSIRTINFDGKEFLLAVAHLISPLYFDAESRAVESSQLAKQKFAGPPRRPFWPPWRRK
jgi:hypothetical protein